jgi:hypothetical protein
MLHEERRLWRLPDLGGFEAHEDKGIDNVGFVIPGILVCRPIHDCQSHSRQLCIISGPFRPRHGAGGICRLRGIGWLGRRAGRIKLSFA